MAAFPFPVALPFDILYLICQQIYTAERHQDLAALSLVSCTCNAAATPWLYRSVKLDFSPCRSLSVFSFRNADKISHHALVRNLAILGHDPYGSRNTVADLTELICSMPNLRRFIWKSAGSIPISLRRILEIHPKVKDVMSESNSIWEDHVPLELKLDQARSDLAQCRHDREKNLRIKSVFDNIAKREGLCFSGYQFPPGSASLGGFNISTLRSLQLNSCRDLAALFDSLLDKVSILELKSLTINQPKSLGASGRDKLEHFLMAYRGLEEIAFSNLGQGRQCMRTISAQSATLRILKLHEPGVSHSKKSYVPWRLADAEIIATRRQHLQDVEDVTNIRRACPQLCKLVIDQVCIDLDVIDT